MVLTCITSGAEQITNLLPLLSALSRSDASEQWFKRNGLTALKFQETMS